MKTKLGLLALIVLGSSVYGQVAIDSTIIKKTELIEAIEIAEPTLLEKQKQLELETEKNQAKEKALEEQLKTAKGKEKAG